MVGNWIVGIGVEPDQTVGLYMPNCVEYVEAMLGCFVARAIPVNINYRYTVAELVHIFGSAGMTALIVDAEYAERAAEVVRAGRRHSQRADRRRCQRCRVARVDDRRSLRRDDRRYADNPARHRPKRRRPGADLHRRHDRAAQRRALATRGLLLLRAQGRQPLRRSDALPRRGRRCRGGRRRTRLSDLRTADAWRRHLRDVHRLPARRLDRDDAALRCAHRAGVDRVGEDRLGGSGRRRDDPPDRGRPRRGPRALRPLVVVHSRLRRRAAVRQRPRATARRETRDDDPQSVRCVRDRLGR